MQMDYNMSLVEYELVPVPSPAAPTATATASPPAAMGKIEIEAEKEEEEEQEEDEMLEPEVVLEKPVEEGVEVKERQAIEEEDGEGEE